VIHVRIDDLAFFEGDAILRPVNEDLGATTPLMRRLEVAAGPKLHEQIRVQEPLPVGAAVVTAAGELGVELLVHAVVMSATEPVSRDSVRRALTSALQRVEAWEIKDVAIAPFGLGAGNLEIEESAEIMMTVIHQHLRGSRFPERVTFFAETPDEERVLTAAVQRNGR
jgi:O-acetyl-ADP-ribose deacetylase (regulator of RNase III)